MGYRLQRDGAHAGCLSNVSDVDVADPARIFRGVLTTSYHDRPAPLTLQRRLAPLTRRRQRGRAAPSSEQTGRTDALSRAPPAACGKPWTEHPSDP